MPENIEEVKAAFYSASKKILEAGSEVIPFNHPLGITIIKIAEALAQEIDIFNGVEPGTNGTNTGSMKPELTDDMIDEIAELENELNIDLDI